MKRKIWIGIGIVVLVALAIVLIVTNTKKEPEEIKIGAIAPLTGDAAIYGLDLKKGMDLALEEINSRGGIKDKNIKIIYEDSQANPKVAVSAINKLINIDKVLMIIGDMFSSTTLAIAPIAQKSKIVLLSPTASAEAVPNTGDYIFSIYPSDAYDGKFLAEFSSKKLKKKNVAIIYVQADAMIVCKEAYKTTLANLGGKVIAEEDYAPKTDDFRSILSKIKPLNPDLIFLSGYLNELTKILRQAREIGITSQFITISTAYDVKLFELAGDSAEGIIISAPFYEPELKLSEVVRFREKFNKKYNEIPNVWAAYGYDVIKICCLAIENSRQKGTEIKTELLNIKQYSGITGETSFLKNGSVEKTLRIIVVRNKEFTKLK